MPKARGPPTLAERLRGPPPEAEAPGGPGPAAAAAGALRLEAGAAARLAELAAGGARACLAGPGAVAVAAEAGARPPAAAAPSLTPRESVARLDELAGDLLEALPEAAGRARQEGLVLEVFQVLLGTPSSGAVLASRTLALEKRQLLLQLLVQATRLAAGQGEGYWRMGSAQFETIVGWSNTLMNSLLTNSALALEDLLPSSASVRGALRDIEQFLDVCKPLSIPEKPAQLASQIQQASNYTVELLSLHVEK